MKDLCVFGDRDCSWCDRAIYSNNPWGCGVDHADPFSMPQQTTWSHDHRYIICSAEFSWDPMKTGF